MLFLFSLFVTAHFCCLKMSGCAPFMDFWQSTSLLVICTHVMDSSGLPARYPAALSASDRFPSVSGAALGISWMNYWLDLHFVKRGKEVGMVNRHLSEAAWSLCWADSNIPDIPHVFQSQNLLLSNDLTGVQELLYEPSTENRSFSPCFNGDDINPI